MNYWCGIVYKLSGLLKHSLYQCQKKKYRDLRHAYPTVSLYVHFKIDFISNKTSLSASELISSFNGETQKDMRKWLMGRLSDCRMCPFCCFMIVLHNRKTTNEGSGNRGRPPAPDSIYTIQQSAFQSSRPGTRRRGHSGQLIKSIAVHSFFLLCVLDKEKEIGSWYQHSLCASVRILGRYRLVLEDGTWKKNLVVKDERKQYESNHMYRRMLITEIKNHT